MSFSRRHSLKALAAAGALGWQSRAAAAPRRLPIKLVVLDVGGTILEDRGDVPAELRKALANHGVTVTAAEIVPWRGASKRAAIRHFVKQKGANGGAVQADLAERVYQEFRANLTEIYRTVPPVAGAEEAIRKLRQSGYLLCATTGFDRDITLPIFERLGWNKNFAAIICSDDVAEGRPAPYMIFHAMEAARVHRVAEVIAVGDTPLDLEAATNAGVRGVVGVCTGAFSRDKLRSGPHTHILPGVADVPTLLSSKF
jgi:phosphonatase-like hydrolase